MDTNALGHYSVIPWLRTSGTVAPGEVYATATARQPTARQSSPSSGTNAGPDGDTVRICWQDGHVDVVRLDG